MLWWTNEGRNTIEDKVISDVDAKVNTKAIHIVDVTTDAEDEEKVMLDMCDGGFYAT